MRTTNGNPLTGPVVIGTLRDGTPVWSMAGGAGDDGNDDSGDGLSFVLPEDLSTLEDDELNELRTEALEAFEELRDRAEELDDDGMAALEALADAVEQIGNEQTRRDDEREERVARADELARRVNPPVAAEDTETEATETEASDEGGDDTTASEGGDEATAEAEEVEAEEQPVAAGGGIRVDLSGIRRRQEAAQPTTPPEEQRPQSRTRMVAADGTPGLTAGAELDVDGLAEVLATRLEGVTISSYQEAFSSGERIKTRLPAAMIRREVPDEFRANRPGVNPQEVITAAVEAWKSELRPGVAQLDTLTASVWCAPSTPIYDLCELETTDGGVSLPGITVDRGGIQNTTGPDFSQIFADATFCFTHAQLEAQSPPGSGPKPAYVVTCPTFTDTRLGVCGTSIRAGLLQNRSFPELVQRTIRGAIVTHAHDVWSRHIADMVAGSEAVSLAANQVGAAAPILTALELQVEHFRYVNRASDTELLEAIFPRYVRGMIRSDLARRQGMALLDVTDADIARWFSNVGVSAQFVKNFDDITGTAASFTQWPDTVRFLLYAPGTWVAGTADIIRIDTLFDSALLAENDFTALFLEEGLLTLKTCADSRVVSVDVTPDGATHGGVNINADGSLGA